MQKLIPTIYFYLLSSVGIVLLIIGIFNSFHYVTGVTAYDKYPLKYGNESRCQYMAAPLREGTEASLDLEAAERTKKECLESLEFERKNTKIDDFEKSIAFTTIGLIVFGVHFYFARSASSGLARKRSS
ncbi:MAG: hypothetical protein WD967_00560 [Candidatus Levyibacteriota bacterium]